MNQHTPFAHQLSTLRRYAQLTNKELGKLARVPHSMIASAQSGKRPIGELQARRLGAALNLSGDELDHFVFQAINTCTERILEEAKAYPAEILNLVARQLHQAGINAEAIKECSTSGSAQQQEVILLLSTGEETTLTTHLAYS